MSDLVYVLKGDGIDGEATDDDSGHAVALSDDGLTVAIGAPKNDGTGTSAGHVRVFEWDSGSSSWTQKGDDIDAEATGDAFGSSVALSDDGLTVAIGAPENDSPSEFGSGHVRVFEWDSGSSSWTQKGDDIDGIDTNDGFGSSVALSGDGTIFAAGATGSSVDSDPGRSQVYEWDSGNSSWVQKGADIIGPAENSECGQDVSLNKDGTIIAIGCPGYEDDKGLTQVYEWDSASSSWTQKGEDIQGEESSDEAGISVDLSGDGLIIAIGAPDNKMYGGHVRVYEWSESAWTQKGVDVEGDNFDKLGISVAMSNDGTILAAGGSGGDLANVYELGDAPVSGAHALSFAPMWSLLSVAMVFTALFG